MEYSDNFFTEELGKYYASQGKRLSSAVITILGKPISQLTETEVATYQSTIQPTRETIRQALAECMNEPEANREEWQEQLLMFHDTIIGNIAAEMLKQERSEEQYAGQHAAPQEPTAPVASIANEPDLTVAEIGAGKGPSKAKRYIVYSGIGLVVVAAIIIALIFTVFKGSGDQLGTTLDFSLPDGFRSEVQQEDEMCGLTVYTIRVFPEGAGEYEGILLTYPYPDPLCYTEEYIEDYSYEVTQLAGQESIIYTTEPSQQLDPALSEITGEADLTAFKIYMVEGQIFIDGSLEYRDEMLSIANSIKWDHPVFETPAVLTGGTQELEGSWAQIDNDDNILSLFPDFHQDVFYCLLEGTATTYWGNGDGRIFESGEDNDLGLPNASVYVNGDGSELYMLVGDNNVSDEFGMQWSGEYRKISEDPFYVVGSPKPGDIDWQEEADFPEDDFSVSATRSLMDAVMAEDYTTINNSINPSIAYGGEAEFLVFLKPTRYKILSYNASGDYITIVVQYENEMGAVHQLELVWETFSTASKTPYLYDFQLDPRGPEESGSGSGDQTDREQYFLEMDTLIAELSSLNERIKSAAIEINNNIDPANNRMKKDMKPECNSIEQALSSLKERANALDVPTGLAQVGSQFVQLVDYCMQRVDSLFAGIYAVESGGDYQKAFEQGVAPKDAYNSLFPSFQSLYNSLKSQ